MESKKLILAVTFALANCILFVRPASATAGWSVTEHITTITSQQGVNGVFITVDSTVYNDGCSSPGSYFLPDDAASPSNTKYKSEFAMLMAAYMENKTVQFYLSGCSSYNAPTVGIITINQ
jgi:hypothetical protein